MQGGFPPCLLKKMNMKEDKIIAHIYESYDYEKFKFMEKGNRDLKHVERIKKSLLNGEVLKPIMINEKFEIVDGQHTYIARKELGLPIYYYINYGSGVKEARLVNVAGQNWTKVDYVKSYSDEGNPEYLKFKEFREMFPDITVSDCEKILNLSLSSANDPKRNDYKRLERGDFKVKDFDAAVRVANMIMAYSPYGKVYKSSSFVSAILKLSRLEHFDNELIITRLERGQAKLLHCSNADDYVEMIEDIANYRRGKNNRIHFDV